MFNRSRQLHRPCSSSTRNSLHNSRNTPRSSRYRHRRHRHRRDQVRHHRARAHRPRFLHRHPSPPTTTTESSAGSTMPIASSRRRRPASVDALNQRFHKGTASSSLQDVGIVLRQFDNTESHEEPWRGCPRGGPTDSNNDCNIFGNRLSASVIFPEQRRGSIDASIPLFAVSSGVIFNPTAFGITCEFTNDGGSRGRSDGCGTDWCPATRGATDGWCDGRPTRPQT